VKVLSLYNTFSKKERRFFVSALLVFVISLSLWGMSVFYGETVPEPVAGGSYIEAVVGQPATVNPLLANENGVDRDLIELLFANLLDLAENYTESEDHQSWTINLKEGLKWSDGEPLTSDDVVFTLEAIQDSNIQSPLYASWQGVIIERLSDQEIKLTLRNPYAFFADNLARLKIVPKHIFGAIPFENLRLSNYNLEPVGSGPYKFSRYDKRKDGFIEKYQLVENPYYVLKAPLIKNFAFRFFERSSNALNAFNTRAVQGLGGLNDSESQKIKTSHHLFTINSSQYYAVFFNPTINSALKDKNIRAALYKATDRKELIKKVFNNRAVLADGPILPFIEGYTAGDGESSSFNPEQARELLEKAGWTIAEDSKDNIRTKKIKDTVIRLSFNIVVPRIPFLIQTANILKNNWSAVGIGLNLTILDPRDIARDIIRTRNYQMLLFGNILNDNPDAFSFWHSSQRFYPGLNLALYENKNVDALLESIRQEFDVEKRAALLAELQEQIRKDQPALFLFSPYYLYAGPKNLGGLNAATIVMPADRFRAAGRWYLRTARIFK